MAELTNTMNVAARFNDVDTTAQSTAIVELGNMTLLKLADQNPWVDGDLTYTVTLENIEDAGDITSIVFSDTLDVTKAQLLTNSVTINGIEAVLGTDFTYDSATGELNITYGDSLAPGQTVTIIFQVSKV